MCVIFMDNAFYYILCTFSTGEIIIESNRANNETGVGKKKEESVLLVLGESDLILSWGWLGLAWLLRLANMSHTRGTVGMSCDAWNIITTKEEIMIMMSILCSYFYTIQQYKMPSAQLNPTRAVFSVFPLLFRLKVTLFIFIIKGPPPSK